MSLKCARTVATYQAWYRTRGRAHEHTQWRVLGEPQEALGFALADAGRAAWLSRVREVVVIRGGGDPNVLHRSTARAVFPGTVWRAVVHWPAAP